MKIYIISLVLRYYTPGIISFSTTRYLHEIFKNTAFDNCNNALAMLKKSDLYLVIVIEFRIPRIVKEQLW